MDDFLDELPAMGGCLDILDMETMPESQSTTADMEHKTEDEYSKLKDEDIVFEDDKEIYTKRDFDKLSRDEQVRVAHLKAQQLSEVTLQPITQDVGNSVVNSIESWGESRGESWGESRGESGGNVSRDIKIERIAAVIAARSDAVTMPNAFGELDTYVARRQQKGGEVVYWDQAYRTELEHLVYTSMLDQDIAKIAKCRLAATASNARAVTDTVLHATYTDRVVDMGGLVMLSSKLTDSRGCEMPAMYYDIDKGEVMSYNELVDEKRGKCFRRFCNTTSNVLHVPIIPESEVRIDLILEHARIAKAEMAAHYEKLQKRKSGKLLAGAYNMRFESTFGRWARDNIGLYVDILTMCATPLMRRKPECTFFILGRAANGKSSLRHLLQAVYGVRNCADVQVSQMGSWDYAATLLNKMVNFPDEEKTSIEEMDKASFKSMSTHENIHIRKKGSSIPFDIKCDFVSIIPLNELPDWKNLDSGVARRVKILPFMADLSHEATLGGEGFEETTYTPEFVSRVIGELIGIASFYSSTGYPILWSDTTEITSHAWQESYDNVRLFKADFDKVFCGFTSVNLLYECYQRWCKGGRGDIDVGIDYTYETKKRLSETFRQFGGYNRKVTLSMDGHRMTCICDERAATAEAVLSNTTKIDMGAAAGLATGIKVVTVEECLSKGADPVTMRLLALGLKREDEETITW